MNLLKYFNFFIFNSFFFFIFFTINQITKNFIFPHDMVFIPGDSYTLLFKEGTDVTSHEVNCFLVDKYPVTNDNYLSYIYFNKKWEPYVITAFFTNKDYLNNWFLNENFFLILNDPIVNISWYSSYSYCKFFNKRLPTLDEWEYISSATDNFPTGINNTPVHVQKILNWYVSSLGQNNRFIKSMFGNYWNVFGLHGIVWEWVYDFNSIIVVDTKSEGGNNEQLLFCGASTENSLNPVDYIGFMRFAFRNSLDSVFSIASLSFRCAKLI